MSKNLIPATASVVREAARAGRFTVPEAAKASVFGTNPKVGARGRIHPAAQAALVEALPKEFVAVPLTNGNAAPKAASTVAVPCFSQKTGRPVKAQTLPIAEVRALAGKPGSKGRLGKADLTAAAKALGFGPREAEVEAEQETTESE